MKVFLSARLSSPPKARASTCAAAPAAAAAAGAAEPQLARRSLLSSACSLALLCGPANAASRGPSAPLVTIEGAAAEVARRDVGSLSYDEALLQGTKQGGNRGTLSANGNATANKEDQAYSEKTAALLAECRRVLALDVYDASRAGAIAALTKDAKAWVALYAPGGSAKKVSGRAFNNGLNQLLGHFAFNGLAPLPRDTLAKVMRNLDETDLELSKGK